jgi:translation initiation factor 1 (eIF-1/SUI1)
MFHKERSSTTDLKNGNKLYKDVTLRKSDRRLLFQAVLNHFHIHSPTALGSTSESKVSSSSSPSTGTTQNINHDRYDILEDIFLRNDGTMFQRTCNLVLSLSNNSPTNVVVHLYFRSRTTQAPSKSTTDQRQQRQEESSVLNTENATNCDYLTSWPYTSYPQCVWIQIVELGQSTWEVPGLALLSVIPISWYMDRVTVVPTPLSEFVCSNGVKHIMRVGIRAVPASKVTTIESNSTTHVAASSVSKSRPCNGIVTIVCVQGNPQPFCVGILNPDLVPPQPQCPVADDSNLDQPPLFGPGCPKGVGVTIIHAYGDDLWRHQVPTTKELDKIRSYTATTQQQPPHSAQLGASVIKNPIGGSFYDAGHYGNVGFIDGQFVQPIQQIQQQPQSILLTNTIPSIVHDNEERDVDQFVEVDGSTAINSSDTVAAILLSTLEGGKGVEIDDGESRKNYFCDDTVDVPVGSAESESKTNCNNEGQEPMMSLTAEEILHDAVCKALASLNLKKDLPMTMANFYALYVLPHRLDGTTILLKKTRYKKFSTYIKEQVDSGLLTAGNIETATANDSLGILTSFNPKHTDLVPYISAQKVAAAASLAAGLNLSVEKRLVVADLYCVPNHFTALLQLDRNAVKAFDATSEERRGTGMLTAKEVRVILEDYIVREGLIDGENPDKVILNGPLTDALYKRKTKNSTSSITSPTPLTLPRRDLMNMWLSCQEPAHAFVQLPGNVVLKLKRGKPPLITIEVSRRQSNKYLTTVVGLEYFDISVLEFAKDVANRFACASTCSKLSATATAEAVILQGNFANEVEALLVSDERLAQHGGVKGSTYCLPKNSIDVVLKKGVPSRKKTQVKK